jgi:hypothetical protein
MYVETLHYECRCGLLRTGTCQVAAERASRSQGGPPDQKNERNRNHEHTENPQKGASPCRAQIIVQRVGAQGDDDRGEEVRVRTLDAVTEAL